MRQLLQRLRTELRAPDGTPALDFRTTFVLVWAAVSMTIFQYFGKSGSYPKSGLAPVLEGMVRDPDTWRGMFPYVYWGTTSVLLRFVIPLLFILFLFREHPRDWGYRLRGQLSHAWTYVGLYLFMLPFLVWASTMPSFQRKYPFWDGAGASPTTFWTYELFYALQFVGVEAFFRGWMIFGTWKKLGWYSVIVMTIPYCLVHFGKPLPETLGAIVAGVVLGWLAIRSGSFVLGIVLHVAIAITMDFLAIARARGGIAEALSHLF